MGGSGRKTTYSVKEEDYNLMEEVGQGASAIVYRAIYLPLNEVVAVKCLDLDRCNSNLDDIRREAQTMSLIDHPSLISAYCSFVVDHYLWVVMPFMAEGSCLHLMKVSYPDGFDEPIICSVLKETLKALQYLHSHGHIHRDIKAGNILLDTNGSVKLGDFGVSACMFDKGGRQRARNTFVGTPCWMAPEVLQPASGYDFKADIWSFGITSLELAHGHAPFSKYPPMKVLLMTIQNAPPGLDYDRDKRFSKSFKEMVAMCLVKDQTKRPTAEKLLKHSFFKSARPPEVTVKNLLTGLPPLWERVRALQIKDAEQLALRKMPSAEQEALSQSEYKRGVSAWNFDIEDLKNQASLVQALTSIIVEKNMIQDDVEHSGDKEDDGNMKSMFGRNSSIYRTSSGQSILRGSPDRRPLSNGGAIPEIQETNIKNDKIDMGLSTSSQEKVEEYELGKQKNDLMSTSKKNLEFHNLRGDLMTKVQPPGGPISLANLTHSFSDKVQISESQSGADKYKRDVRKIPSFSGPLMLPNRASANSLSAPTAPVRSSGGYRDSHEEKSKVQIKGRFSVTSENVDLVKDIPLCTVPRRTSQSPLRKSASVGDWMDPKQESINQSIKDIGNTKLPASVLLPQLQNLYQQTSFQRDLIMNLLNSFQPTENASETSSVPLNLENIMLVEPTTSEREQLLLTKISEMQARVSGLTDELTAAKVKHVQLQQQLTAAYGQEEERRGREEKES